MLPIHIVEAMVLLFLIKAIASGQALPGPERGHQNNRTDAAGAKNCRTNIAANIVPSKLTKVRTKGKGGKLSPHGYCGENKKPLFDFKKALLTNKNPPQFTEHIPPSIQGMAWHCYCFFPSYS
jgi:hypothetical protein